MKSLAQIVNSLVKPIMGFIISGYPNRALVCYMALMMVILGFLISILSLYP